MTELQFKLDVFEGPLDLLLHLISKHQLNIHDIEISKLLEQYLLYIDTAKEQNLELAGEFLEMAARLIYIKTVSLLPKPEEAEKAKKELQGTLIEYAIAQVAAGKLREQFNFGDIFVRQPLKLPKIKRTYSLQHSPDRLAEIFARIGKERMTGHFLTDKITDTITQKKAVSVISKVVYILRQLYTGNPVTVSSLYQDMTDRSARVATFLAVLELTRSGRIVLNEDNTVLTMGSQKGRKQA